MEAGVNYDDLRNLKPHGADRGRITLSQIFDLLYSPDPLFGLTTQEAERRLVELGYNKGLEEKQKEILKFLQFMWTPMAWFMEFGAFMAIAFTLGRDWEVFVGVVMLLLINSTISYCQEYYTNNLATTMMARVSLKARVLRDGVWTEGVDATNLVVGDIISIKPGDIVPADALLILGYEPLEIDQCFLTGEPFSGSKVSGESVYSGTICKQGCMTAIVYATGVRTLYKKVAHLSDSLDRHGHFQKVLASIRKFCIGVIVLGMFVESIVMYPIQKRSYRSGIHNLLVLLIGGIPIAMPTVLSHIMAIGSHRLSQQGVIIKKMEAIEEMAGMDVLCSDKIGTLTPNQPAGDVNLVVVFGKETGYEVTVMAARAVPTENQNDIDVAIINMLGHPAEARNGIREMEFFPSNPMKKCTCIIYADDKGDMYQACKGPPEQILSLIADDENKTAIQETYDSTLNRFVEEGFLSIAVASSKVKEPWKFLGLVPLSYLPREDNVTYIKKALKLGLQVKMITGDRLAIAKGMGSRLGMGDCWHDYATLSRPERGEFSPLYIDDLIEKADGFANVLPGHKYEMVRSLQARNHICGITGDGVNDVHALKIADIGIALTNATDAARDASDIVLTKPGLGVIIQAILTSREIFNGMKNYTIYAVSITIHNVLGFMLLALIWKFDFPPFMVLLVVLLNNGIVMTISKDRAKPSQLPDSWKLREIFTTGIALGLYLASVTVFFFWVASENKILLKPFGVDPLHRESPDDLKKLASAVYLQVSISSHALIFVTRARSWSFTERPGYLLISSFIITQLVATVIAVYAPQWLFAAIGWNWAGFIWVYGLISYIPLDIIRFVAQCAMVGKGWDHLVQIKDGLVNFIVLLVLCCQD